ncbi:Unconventional myosin-IXb [Phlyctochytrium planicorne]|nr:Unconventional myosin-IXb [Phlyctochytrium planicorne]
MKKLLRRISSVGLARPTWSPFNLTIEQLVGKDKESNPDTGGPNDSKDRGSKSDLDAPTENVPSIMQQFIRFLSTQPALETEGLFRTAGSSKVTRELRDELEKNQTLDFAAIEEFNIPSVATIFKQWLRDIPDGLISKKYFQAMLDAGSSPSNIKEVLLSIPQANYSSLYFLLKYLFKVSSFSQFNRMSVQNLVIVFAPNIFRCPSAPSGSNKGSPEKYLIESMEITKTMVVIMDHFKEIFEQGRNHQSYLARVLGKEHRAKWEIRFIQKDIERQPMQAIANSHLRHRLELILDSLQKEAGPVILQRVASETVKSMLFSEPKRRDEEEAKEKGISDDDVLVRPSVIAKTRGRSLSCAINPSNYADIRGAQQSLLDELKAKVSPATDTPALELQPRKKSLSADVLKPLDSDSLITPPTDLGTKHKSPAAPSKDDDTSSPHILKSITKDRPKPPGRRPHSASQPGLAQLHPTQRDADSRPDSKFQASKSGSDLGSKAPISDTALKAVSISEEQLPKATETGSLNPGFAKKKRWSTSALAESRAEITEKISHSMEGAKKLLSNSLDAVSRKKPNLQTHGLLTDRLATKQMGKGSPPTTSRKGSAGSSRKSDELVDSDHNLKAKKSLQELESKRTKNVQAILKAFRPSPISTGKTPAEGSSGLRFDGSNRSDIGADTKDQASRNGFIRRDSGSLSDMHLRLPVKIEEIVTTSKQE